MGSCADEAAGHEPADAESYRTLGLAPDVSDTDLRRAYRRLALLHHPDHNAGSPLAGSRFVEIQDAYDTVLSLRHRSGDPGQAPTDPWLQSRIATVDCEYTERRGSELADADPEPSPYAPRPPQVSLRARLTDWFREA